jgi:hypothetical protein
MLNIQALIDGMNLRSKQERAASQMTLGRLIELLSNADFSKGVPNLRNPHSYRGYYSDLAFELREGRRPVYGLLEDCRNSMGKTFEGYKGGDYDMGAQTPVWVANYGSCGLKLISITPDGEMITMEDTC